MLKFRLLILSFLISTSLAAIFNCDAALQEKFCSQMNGCTWANSKCSGTFKPECKDDEKCLYICPSIDLPKEDQNGTYNYPYQSYSDAMESLDKSQNYTFVSLNLPKEEFIFDSGFNLTTHNIKIIPFFDTKVIIIVDSIVQLADKDTSLTIQDSHMIINKSFISFQAYSSPLTIINSLIEIKDKQNLLNQQGLFHCEHRKSIMTLKNITIPDLKMRVFIESSCNLQIENVSISNSINPPMPIIQITNGTSQVKGLTITNSSFKDDDSMPFILLSHNTAIWRHVNIQNISAPLFQILSTHTHFKYFDINNITGRYIMQFSNNYQAEFSDIQDINVTNINVSYSVFPINEYLVAFHNLQIKNSTFNDPTAHTHGLCMQTQQSNVAISSSKFLSINGQCLFFMGTLPQILLTTFDNQNLDNYLTPRNIPYGWSKESSYIILGENTERPIPVTLSQADVFLLNGCVFKNNQLFPDRGGALHIRDSIKKIKFYMHNNTFENIYSAFAGGAVYLDFRQIKFLKSYVEIQQNIFKNTMSPSTGGAIHIIAETNDQFKLGLVNNTFNSSEAVDGGAVFIYYKPSNLTYLPSKLPDRDIYQNIFVNCQGSDEGGAITMVGVKGGNFSRNYFKNNTAQLGGAVSFFNSTTNVLSDNEFWDNFASNTGGAILYFGTGNVSHSFKGFDTNLVNFTKYIPDQVVVQMSNFRYKIETYDILVNLNMINEFNPRRLIQNLKYTKLSGIYDEKNVTNDLNIDFYSGHPFTKIIVAKLLHDNGTVTELVSEYPLKIYPINDYTFLKITQTSNFIINKGEIVLLHQEEISSMDSNVSSTICIRHNDNYLGQFMAFIREPLNLCFNIEFKPCPRGDIFDHGSNLCQTCPNNTYYLGDPYDVNASCMSCPQNAKCFGGDKIVPDQGYYILESEGNETASKVQPIKCLNQNACLGGANFQNLSLSTTGFCANNLEGPLCNSCGNGFYESSEQSKCLPCEIDIWFLLQGSLIFLLQLSFIIIELYRYFSKSTALRKSILNNDEIQKKQVQSRYNASASFKTVVSFFQMIVIIKTASFQWQSQYFTIISNIPLLSSSNRISCIWNALGIHSQEEKHLLDYLFEVARPLLIIFTSSILICCFGRSQRSGEEISSANQNHLSNTKNKIIVASLISLYIYQPSILTNSFNLFACIELPNMKQKFIATNLNLSCNSNMYNRIYLPLGVFMILLWGIILPLILVFKIRSSIIKAKSEEERNEGIIKYSFITAGFKEKYYYWEFILSAKKIALILIIAELVQYGLVSASLIIIFTLYILISLNSLFNPFQSSIVKWMDSMSLYTIIMIVFTGIIYKLNGIAFLDDVGNKEGNTVFLYFLVVVCFIMAFIIFITFIWFYFNVYKNRVISKLKNLQAKFRKSDDVDPSLTVDGQRSTEVNLRSISFKSNDSESQNKFEINSTE